MIEFVSLGGEDDIRIAAFRTPDAESRRFLSRSQLQILREIVSRTKPSEEPKNGKFLSQPNIFEYWEFSETKEDFIKHSIALNDKGGSSNLRIADADREALVALIQDLRADRTEDKR